MKTKGINTAKANFLNALQSRREQRGSGDWGGGSLSRGTCVTSSSAAPGCFVYICHLDAALEVCHGVDALGVHNRRRFNIR